MTATKAATKLVSSAPTAEQLAALVAARPQANQRMPFQHMGDIFLLTVWYDQDINAIDTVGHDGAPYDPSNHLHKARHIHPRYLAWKRGDWVFLGLDVQLARHPEAQDSLWGIESDSGPEYLAHIMHDLCAEIMRRVDGGVAVDAAALALGATADDIARQAEYEATLAKLKAEKAIAEAEKVWHKAKGAILHPEAKESTLLELGKYRETIEQARNVAADAEARANGAYEAGTARPQPPYLISGCLRLIATYLPRLDWMVEDLRQPKSYALIAAKVPDRVVVTFEMLGMDPHNPEHALTILTTPWDDEQLDVSGITWRNLDFTAAWIILQPEVVQYGMSCGVNVARMPLPSKL